MINVIHKIWIDFVLKWGGGVNGFEDYIRNGFLDSVEPQYKFECSSENYIRRDVVVQAVTNIRRRQFVFMFHRKLAENKLLSDQSQWRSSNNFQWNLTEVQSNTATKLWWMAGWVARLFETYDTCSCCFRLLRVYWNIIYWNQNTNSISNHANYTIATSFVFVFFGWWPCVVT